MWLEAREPKIISKLPEARKRWEGFSPTGFREKSPAKTMISDF